MNDLDAALRTMLRERAGDVTDVPAFVADDLPPAPVERRAAVDLAPHRRRALVPALAAAAVAALIAGVGYAVAGSHEHRPPHPVAHPPLPTVSRTWCRATVPASWQAAVRLATESVDGGSAGVMAATAGGGTVVQDDGGAQLHTLPWVGVGYVAPGATTVDPLAHFVIPTAPNHGPYRSTSTSLSADSDGTTVVLSWATGLRSQQVRTIDVVDVDTRARHVVARSSHYARGTRLSEGYAQDGVVYWEADRAGKGAFQDTVWSYDVATGHVTRVAGPGTYDLTKSAAGVMWNLTGGAVDRPAALPAAVAAQVNADNASSFVTDGRSYAWVTRRGDLGWWGPGANRVVLVRGLLSRPWRLSTPGVPFAVAGPIVQYQVPRSGENRIVDVRTGATVPAAGSLKGSGGELLAGPLTVGGADVGADQLMRLPAAALPRLRC